MPFSSAPEPSIAFSSDTFVARPKGPTHCDHAPELERVEGISQRRVDDPAEHDPRERQAEPLGQQPPRRSQAQRPDLETLGPTLLERPLERRLGARTPREQVADVLTLQSTGRERQRVGGRTIEPRDVVDGHDERFRRGQSAEQAEEADGDRMRLRWRSCSSSH